MNFDTYRFIGSTCYFIRLSGLSEKVVSILGKNGRLYPYRWDKKLNCWNECSNVYTLPYIRRLEKAGKIIYR